MSPAFSSLRDSYETGSSSIARFITTDPLRQSALWDPQRLHVYAYARNNPLTFVDSSGLSPSNPWGLSAGLGYARSDAVWVTNAEVNGLAHSLSSSKGYGIYYYETEAWGLTLPLPGGSRGLEATFSLSPSVRDWEGVSWQGSGDVGTALVGPQVTPGVSVPYDISSASLTNTQLSAGVGLGVGKDVPIGPVGVSGTVVRSKTTVYPLFELSPSLDVSLGGVDIGKEMSSGWQRIDSAYEQAIHGMAQQVTDTVLELQKTKPPTYAKPPAPILGPEGQAKYDSYIYETQVRPQLEALPGG